MASCTHETTLNVHFQGVSARAPLPSPPAASSAAPTRQADGSGTRAEPSKRTAPRTAAPAHAGRRPERLRPPPRQRVPQATLPHRIARAPARRRLCRPAKHRAARSPRGCDRRRSHSSTESCRSTCQSIRRRRRTREVSTCVWGSRVGAGGSPMKSSSMAKSAEGEARPPHRTAGERPPRSPGCVEAPHTSGGLRRFDEGASKRRFRPAQCEPCRRRLRRRSRQQASRASRAARPKHHAKHGRM